MANDLSHPCWTPECSRTSNSLWKHCFTGVSWCHGLFRWLCYSSFFRDRRLDYCLLVTRIAKDHDKQSYEDQDSDPPMIEASDELSPSMSVSLPHEITVPQLPCPSELQPNHIPTCTPLAPLMLIPAGTDDQALLPAYSTETEPALPPTVSLATGPVPHANPLPVPTNNHSMVTRSKNNIHRPRQSSDDFIHYPLPKALRAALGPTATEPTSYSQASKSVHWQEAMNQEFSALIHNGIPGPWSHLPHMQILWDTDGFTKSKERRMEPLCYKARLVAKGFHQQTAQIPLWFTLSTPLLVLQTFNQTPVPGVP
uniref:Reverse transcriptase Ty1/copia-type domain-containing protein n=1 Tax=Populus davidiana TaxID=266767 RepID=A0A6M2EZD4_9ROSI